MKFAYICFTHSHTPTTTSTYANLCAAKFSYKIQVKTDREKIALDWGQLARVSTTRTRSTISNGYGGHCQHTHTHAHTATYLNPHMYTHTHSYRGTRKVPTQKRERLFQGNGLCVTMYPNVYVCVWVCGCVCFV